MRLEPEGNAFGPEAGGVLCPTCAPRHHDALALEDAVFRVLRFLQTREWPTVRHLELAPATSGALERLAVAYIRHLLERDLKSVEFLRNLRGLSREGR